MSGPGGAAALADRLLILGASGDLTGRYLLPAIAELAAAGSLPETVRIVGVAPEPMDTEEFRRHAAERLVRHAARVPARARAELVSRLSYVAGDATDAAVVDGAAGGSGGPVVAYLALPPAVFVPAIEALGHAGLPPGSRVVVEKPFGLDLNSARMLNELLHRHFPEEAVFRMDHFLGMQTVQNILGIRFANRVFEPLWCAEHVERVDIVWDETLALEGRAGYYDGTGAMRDMVQNHLLQLLALMAMERPGGLDARRLRDAKLAALRDVRRPTSGEVAATSIRARYTAGRVAGRELSDYTDEPGVDPARGAETFAEVTLHVDNERWRGVPFRLRTGKALAADRRQISVAFRPVDHLPFGAAGDPGPNRMVLSIDPDHMALDIVLNGAGDPFHLEPARLAVDLAPQELSAYARLLLYVFHGDPVLSTRGDEAEESWRIVEPVLAGWEAGLRPMRTYPAGSTGPDGA